MPAVAYEDSAPGVTKLRIGLQSCICQQGQLTKLSAWTVVAQQSKQGTAVAQQGRYRREALAAWTKSHYFLVNTPILPRLPSVACLEQMMRRAAEKDQEQQAAADQDRVQRQREASRRAKAEASTASKKSRESDQKPAKEVRACVCLRACGEGVNVQYEPGLAVGRIASKSAPLHILAGLASEYDPCMPWRGRESMCSTSLVLLWAGLTQTLCTPAYTPSHLGMFGTGMQSLHAFEGERVNVWYEPGLAVGRVDATVVRYTVVMLLSGHGYRCSSARPISALLLSESFEKLFGMHDSASPMSSTACYLVVWALRLKR
eukprot:scaffold97537_cov19-Tisochrysis_lutea.AAC.2